MAASTFWVEENGTAGGTPARGNTATTGISNINFGSRDQANLTIASNVITGGTNSYDKYNYIMFSGSWNQLLNGRFNHSTGNLGVGISLFCLISGSGFYNTPSQGTNAQLNREITQTGLTSTGIVSNWVSTGAYNNDYALTATSGVVYNNAGWVGAVAYTPYIIQQIRTLASASAGDGALMTWTFAWDEN